ncbi:uncharacterized protein PG998_000421 [Apiospora kogelbergensis]|uniref:uncharacterized protein n=1 Tax=Apiospora kogelbergensis TaxID=1337665 RepID=UPI00312E91E4
MGNDTAIDADMPEPIVYSVAAEAHCALQALVSACMSELPRELDQYIDKVTFSSTSPAGDKPCFPCPLKEQEAGCALKALEGCLAGAIADLRYGSQGRDIEVDPAKVTSFLMSAYITTLDGMGKAHPKIKYRLPDTDLNQAQSNLYRRLSANLYETCNTGQYYHIHGSLEASTTLRMLGLPPFLAGSDDYHQCIAMIENAVNRLSTADLEHKNEKYRQAGAPALTKDQFRQTAHGKAMAGIAPFTVQSLDAPSPPITFPALDLQHQSATGIVQCLTGIRVLELCRVIAGPTIGRSLAAHGASVLKVTSAKLPDVPFFQLDVNTGKHTTSLHLKDPRDRAAFESLLATADIIIDGYRPGVLASLGYSPESLAAKAQECGRGIVYVAEDCFGGTGVPGAAWSHRPGWQQIADCVTGVAWEQGWFMGLEEPVVPPFPISDYATGILGTIAALAALHRRAVSGGSWIARTSLVQYDIFLLHALNPYPLEVQEHLWDVHDRNFFGLRHSDSVDEVSARALRSMQRLYPELFHGKMLHKAFSPGFGGEVAWPKEPLKVAGIAIGHVRTTRPNNYDAPSWDGWERDESMLV